MTLDIQQAEIIAPKILTVLILYTQTRQRFSAGTGEGTYAIVIPAEQTMSCILIDPDERCWIICSNGWA